MRAVCGVIALLYLWTARNEGVSWNFGQRQTDYYNLLVEGFLDGHLHMNVPVAPELLKLADPYNPSTRPPGLALHDASMYRGHYYLYFGAAPAVTLMLPFRVVSGQGLPLPVAVCLFTWGGFLVSVALLGAIRRRYFSQSSLGVFLLCIVVLGTASMGPLLVLRSSIWEFPLAGAYFYVMLSLYCVFRSVHSISHSVAWMAAASITLGLAVASRPTYLFSGGILAAPLLWWLWSWWRTRSTTIASTGPGRFPWRLLVAAVGPIGAVGAAMAWYNYARFGSFTEFGVKYQLSGVLEADTQHFRFSYLPLNLRMYFTQPAEWIRYFPFIQRAETPTVPPGYVGYDDLFGVLVNAPFVWLAAFAPLALVRRTPGPRARLMVMGAVLALTLAGSIGTLAFFYAAMARYGADFMPALLLLASIGAMAVEGYARPGKARWKSFAFGGIVGGLGAASVFFAVTLSWYAYDNLHRLSPKTYERMARRLNAPSHWLETLAGTAHGPLELSVRFPAKQPAAGTREVLVSTGGFDTTDVVYVQYESAGTARMGFSHDGGAPELSRPLRLMPEATRRLRVELGSLYPPEAHPYFSDLGEAQRARLARRLRVVLDDDVVLDSYQRFHVASPADVIAGRPRFPTAERKRFSGEIAIVGRDGDIAKLLAETMERRTMRVQLAGVAEGARQPLCTTGKPTEPMTWYLVKNAGEVSLGLLQKGKGGWESAPYATDLTAVHEIELTALVSPVGTERVVVKWDRVPLGTCAVPGVSARGEFIVGEGDIAGDGSRAAFGGAIQRADDGESIRQFDTVRLTVKFPAGRSEGREPLVVTGEPGRGDFLFVEYLPEGRVQFGLDHWGKPTLFSGATQIDFARTHTLEIAFDSFPGARAASAGAKPHCLQVVMGGYRWKNSRALLYATTADDVFVGRNPIGGTGCATLFSGAILDVKRVSTGVFESDAFFKQ